MVETRADVDRVLTGSSIPLCLDTGHLLIGGTDPLELARAVPDRVAHAHLKDVDAGLAARVQSGELTYTEAVANGMYTPLGTGGVDIAGIVTVLRDNGFDGWFVLEQDTILAAEPTDDGPVRDVVASVTYLRRAAVGAPPPSRYDAADRGCWGHPESPSSRSSGPHTSWATGWWRWPRVTRGAHRCSPKSMVWSAFLASYGDVVNDPEVDVVYNPWRMRCTRPGTWRRSRRASRSSPRSRSPATAPRPSGSPRPPTPRASP